MGQKIECVNGHPRPGSTRSGARELVERGTLAVCPRCGEPMHYFVGHSYPYRNVTREYDVVKVRVLRSEAQAEEEGYDPMMFLLRDCREHSLTVWGWYWTKNKKGKWASGGSPPLLTIDELAAVVREFQATQDSGN